MNRQNIFWSAIIIAIFIGGTVMAEPNKIAPLEIGASHRTLICQASMVKIIGWRISPTPRFSLLSLPPTTAQPRRHTKTG